MTGPNALRAQAAVNASSIRSPSKRNEPQRRKYSTREPTWAEQLELPERFHKDGEGVWPAEKIIRQKGEGKSAEYLIEWESHPRTGECWKPTWVSRAQVGEPLLNAWNTKRRGREVDSRGPFLRLEGRRRTNRSDSADIGVRTPERRLPQRNAVRIVESSSDTELILPSPRQQPKRVPPRKSSVSSPSCLEVQETQQRDLARPIEILVPRADIDTADYAILADSQSSLNVSSPTQNLTREETPGNQSSQLSSRFLHPILEASFRSPATLFDSSVGNSNKENSLENIAHIGRSTEKFPKTSQIVIGTIAGDPIHRSGSETQSASPAVTEASSDLFFPSPRRGGTSQSSSSPPEDRRSITLSQTPGVQIPKSSDLASKRTESLLASAQRSLESIIDSQASSTSLKSIRLPELTSPKPSPWEYQTQIPSDLQRVLEERTAPSLLPAASLLHHRKTRTLADRLERNKRRSKGDERQLSTSMTVTAVVERSSPRLRPATPNTDRKLDTSVNFGERIRRARNNLYEPKSPSVPPVRLPTPVALGNNTNQNQIVEIARENASASESPLRNQLNMDSAAVIVEEPALASSLSQQSSVYDTALGSSAMPVHHSVEDEETSNNTSESGKMQIQQSIESEQLVSQADGVIMPTGAILSPGEYAIPLPADGRVQSVYGDIVRSKKRSILKFIRKKNSSGVRSANRTPEYMEMAELIDRLSDVVTHIDLGLDHIATQYPLGSEDNARYANYAGSKFTFLDLLIDELQSTNLSVLVFAKPGRVQTLLESFLVMKGVLRRRPSGSAVYDSESPEQRTRQLSVELKTPGANTEMDLENRPALIIAFDSAFDKDDSQIKRLKDAFPDSAIPIIRLLITNSTEHIDRCIPVSMPSPQRLRLLVRATYQASNHLGGGPMYVPLASDALDPRVDLQEIQRVVKKSPERKVRFLAAAVGAAILSDDFEAKWPVTRMPDPDFDELDDSPPKSSRALSLTPISRSGTPSLRKRLLEVGDLASSTKRQRLTPLHDVTHISDSVKDPSSQLEALQNALAAAREELVNEKKARSAAEDARDYAQLRLEEKTQALAGCQYRLESSTKIHRDLRKKSKVLEKEVLDAKTNQEKSAGDVTILKDQVTQFKADLTAARENLVNEGGNVAALELAQQEARTLAMKNAVVEKSLVNATKDFEFTRSEYQKVSNKAFEFTHQISELEAQVTGLKAQASDEKRRLRELNYQESIKQHLAKVAELELEKKNRDVILRKLEEEVKTLKKNRGVQTRGSSVQPPGSPGPRSRQGSPAPGHLGLGVRGPSDLSAGLGGRASVLRNER